MCYLKKAKTVHLREILKLFRICQNYLTTDLVKYNGQYRGDLALLDLTRARLSVKERSNDLVALQNL